MCVASEDRTFHSNSVILPAAEVSRVARGMVNTADWPEKACRFAGSVSTTVVPCCDTLKSTPSDSLTGDDTLA